MTVLRRVPNALAVAAGMTVAALVVALVALWPGPDRVRVTAHFTRTVGLYPGSDVRILGIAVGQVLSVEPAGESVQVVLEYDGQYPVPADAQAAVVSPSVVSDRFVQLLPAYTGGPVLEDGARIPLERTAVPVELDRVYAGLDDLAVALGPQGANAAGALSRLLETAAANLDGQGAAANQTTRDLSLAVQTLAGGRDDLFGTVENLQTFTTVLATSDEEVRELNSGLAAVADQLDAERDDLAAALANLAVALQEVSTFVADNRQVLGDDLAALEEVTGTVVARQQELAETLENAPVALSNLQNAYNPATGTLDTRNNVDQLSNPALFLCSLVSGAVSGAKSPVSSADRTLCHQVQPLLEPLLAASDADTSGLPLDLLKSPAGDGTLGGILPKAAP